jgi:hypothetical protein
VERRVLIDSTHKSWIYVTASIAVVVLLFYGICWWHTPGGLTGGTTVGLWFGIAGSLLMVFEGMLSALRKVPGAWWLGPRKAWLRGHIWLGLLSLVFILCHSGFSWGNGLTFALWLVFLGVIVTGLYGLFLQQFVPRMMTARVPSEAPYEQIPHLCNVLRFKADALVDAICQPPDVQKPGTIPLEEGTRTQVRDFYDRQVRPFLQPHQARRSPLANPLRAEAIFATIRSLPGASAIKDQLAQLEAFCDERRQFAIQERIHHLLHGWLLVHIPLSVALLVLGIAHIVTATLWY